MKRLANFFCVLLICFADLSPVIGASKTGGHVLIREIKNEKQKPGLVIASVEGTTTEDGGEVIIPVRLNQQPIGQVFVYCSSLDESEGRVKTGRLSFSAVDWFDVQHCLVQGQDDFLVDGDREYSIELSVSSETDMGFAGVRPYRVILLNRDNDTPAIVLNPIDSLTSESGKSASFTLQLASKPAADVEIPFSSSDRNEGVTEPEVVTFTPGNWSIPQTIRVKGQDDAVMDGPRIYFIQGGPASSADPHYHALRSVALRFINEDDDQAGFRMVPNSWVTMENGPEVQALVTLQSEPVGSVFLLFTSSNPAEGDVIPSKLVFTSADWHQPQIVRIIGRDDAVADGDQAYNLTVSSKNSSDTAYARLPDQRFSFLNRDDDTAGFLITKEQTRTSENGALAKFGIRLMSEPLADVRLNFRSSDPGEGRVLLKSILFTRDNWFLEKTQSVRGIDDDDVDGDTVYTIIIDPPVTDDPLYASIDPEDVELINEDNDEAGISVFLSGEETNEQGSQVTASIRLSARPKEDFFLTLESSDLSEALVEPEQLLFSPESWNRPQTVFITGQPDGLVDGDQQYRISLHGTSRDKQFHGITSTIDLVNRDINSYWIVHQLQSAETSESGVEALLQLKLNSNPGAAVTVVIETDDPGEGNVYPDKIIVNTENWDRFQDVTIRGVDDDIRDGDQAYLLKIFVVDHGDSGFSDAPVLEIPMTNLDDDKAGISIRELSSELSEVEGQAEFALKLTSEPESSVVFIFSSSDETEAEMLDPYAAFFPDNWHEEQIIRVKGAKDNLIDGSQEFYVTSLGGISKDPVYSGMPFPKIKMRCLDSDQAGFIVGELDGRVSEDGDKASFAVRLTSIPAATVSINLDSDNHDVGRVEPETIEFDTHNWNLGQRVMVTGVDDYKKEGNRDFLITFSPATSQDYNYLGLSPEPVHLTNHDRMKLEIGVVAIHLRFTESFQGKINDATAFGFLAGYSISRSIDLEFGFQTVAAEGSASIKKHNLENPMVYRLNHSSVSLGAKKMFRKTMIVPYLKGGVEMVFWNLESRNELTDKCESNSGVSPGIYAGLGLDFPLFRAVRLALEISYHASGGGLGNSQRSLGLKYPF